MNKFSVFGIYMLICTAVSGQTVTVKTQPESVEGSTIDGYSVELEGKKDNVLPALVKFLKEYGKVRQGDHITVSDPTFNATAYAGKILHALVTAQGDKTVVWIGMKAPNEDDKDIDKVRPALEKTVQQFGLKYYRDKIQLQIGEAQQASDAVEKQKQKLINQHKDLVINLANNEKERVQLEKSVEQNKLEKIALELKTTNNRKAQDSLLRAGEQINKIKAVHQERQRKVN